MLQTKGKAWAEATAELMAEQAQPQHDHMMWTRIEHWMWVLCFELNLHNIQGVAAWYSMGDDLR